MATFLTSAISYSSMLDSRVFLDEIMRRCEQIEAIGFYDDPFLQGYIMRVQPKDPDFRFNLEDF